MKKQRLPGAIIGSLLLILSATSGYAQDFSQVQIKAIKVKPGIHMLLGQGGNIGVFSGEDGVFMIDDQYAPLTEKIKTAIAFTDKQKALDFERYLKTSSGRAFAKKRL